MSISTTIHLLTPTHRPVLVHGYVVSIPLPTFDVEKGDYVRICYTSHRPLYVVEGKTKKDLLIKFIPEPLRWAA